MWQRCEQIKSINPVLQSCLLSSLAINPVRWLDTTRPEGYFTQLKNTMEVLTLLALKHMIKCIVFAFEPSPSMSSSFLPDVIHKTYKPRSSLNLATLPPTFVYYTKHTLKNKSWGRPGNVAKIQGWLNWWGMYIVCRKFAPCKSLSITPSWCHQVSLTSKELVQTLIY